MKSAIIIEISSHQNRNENETRKMKINLLIIAAALLISCRILVSSENSVGAVL